MRKLWFSKKPFSLDKYLTMLIVVKGMVTLKNKLKVRFKLNSFSMNLKLDEPTQNKGTKIHGVKLGKPSLRIGFQRS